MMHFLEYLIEAKRGRKPISATHDDDIAYLHSINIDTSVNSTQKLNSIRRQYLNSIAAAGHDTNSLANKSLKELADYMEKNGIKPTKHLHKTDGNYAVDVKFIRRQDPNIDAKDIRKAITKSKADFIKKLTAAGKKLEDIESKSLAELADIAKTSNIDLNAKSERKLAWKKHEEDVADGIKRLFDSKFFKFKSRKAVDAENYNVEVLPVGGGTKSDVQVIGPNFSFFVECKLDFASSNYFKYGLKIHNDKIVYDHSRYLEGKEAKDEEAFKKIDSLFKEIDISGFLNDIVKDKHVVDSWKKFLDNAKAVQQFIQKSPEFKKFSSGIKFTGNYPEDFAKLTLAFDKYCKFYIEKYNSLIDQLFLLFDSSSLNKQYFKIRSHGDGEDGTFMKLGILQAQIEEDHLEVFDRESFGQTIKLILTIEAKLNALLKSLGKNDSNVDEVLRFKSKDKAKCFFQMFLSSVGRKKKADKYNMLAQEDQLGNLVICAPIHVENSRLAQMITKFYVKKDNCYYIQIADCIYQLDRKLNPLALPDLPIFEEHVNEFDVIMHVSDDLKHISLKIFANEVDQKKLSKYNRLSFKKNDANYIGHKRSITINA